MEYYLAIKRNKVLTHATTEMNVETILNERSHKQKTTYCLIDMKCPE